MRHTTTILAGIAAAAFWGSGCSRPAEVTQVDLEDVVTGPTAKDTGPPPLRVAVGAMITPKEGFTYYQQLLAFVCGKVDREMFLTDKKTYQEVNDALRNGEIDLAFLCSGPYVDGHEQFGLELLAAPVVDGEQVYRADIIVPVDSTATSLADLRGKSFAFTDPDSNTGRLVPTYMLAKLGHSPDSFFGQTLFTYAHDRSIEAVAESVVDGASIDSLVYENERHARPDLVARTKVIDTSEPWAIWSPICPAWATAQPGIFISRGPGAPLASLARSASISV